MITVNKKIAGFKQMIDPNKKFRVWILDVDRWGDTQQMRTLAEATPGIEYTMLHLRSRKGFPKLRRIPRHSIGWLHPKSRMQLIPPWPDAVFLAGRTAVSVALWIRKQNPSTKLIAFGRPFAPYGLFDLVLSNVAFFPPDRPNVMCLRAPLHVIDIEKMHTASRMWQEKLKNLPRPHIALLVGGRSSPYRFTPEEAARLGHRASTLAKQSGGSLLVTTNYRVNPASARALFDAISAPAYLHDCQNGEENPYLAFLGAADAIVVTIDSLSMMTEAASSGSRVFIYPLEEERALLRDWLDWIYDKTQIVSSLAPLHTLLRAIEDQGILLRRADRKKFAEWLISLGYAEWFSEQTIVKTVDRSKQCLNMKDELNLAVDRLLSVLKND